MNPEIHTMTGAYAVDALDADERRFFEAHLVECEACDQEVRELQATAARLGASTSEAPPPGLRDAVLAEIDTVRQERPAPPATMPRPTRTWASRLLAPAAAVLAIAVVGLSAITAELNQRIDELEIASTRVADVVAAPDAEIVEVTGDDGSSARVVVAPGRGEGVFLASGMPTAPGEQVYELWVMDAEGTPNPAGVFDTEQGRATRVMTGDMADASAIAVTVEPEGGSPQPTSDPIMVLTLDS